MTRKWRIKAFYLDYIKQNWSWIWININVKYCVWSSNHFQNSSVKVKQYFQQKWLSLKSAKFLRKWSARKLLKCSASLETRWNILSTSNILQQFHKIFLTRLLNCKLTVERSKVMIFLNHTCLSFAFESILKAKLSATFFC